MDAAGLSSSRFWAFSLELYADEAVAAASVDLQDRFGLDVNMLLFALYAGARGRALSRRDIEVLDRAIDPWRSNVVRPLRGVRRWLKEHASAADDRAAALRKSVLERELESEACQQELMDRTLPVVEGAPSVDAAADNLVRYVRCAGVDDIGPPLVPLATLLARAFALTASAATAAISGSAARTD